MNEIAATATITTPITQDKSPVSDKTREVRLKLQDPNFLPTHREFEMAYKPNDKSAAFDFFTFSKGETTHRNNPVYEVWNEEYVSGLSSYLMKRAVRLGATTDRPLIILEVGAGDGRLTHFLTQKIAKKKPGLVRIIPIDDRSQQEFKVKPVTEVEALSSKQALEKYRPQIVISSWMSNGIDLTTDMRSTKSVDEYILIGEREVCGHDWLTWGKNFDSGKDKKTIPPYKKDGFTKVKLADLTRLQICRTDAPGYYTHSETYSFRRSNISKLIASLKSLLTSKGNGTVHQ